MRRYFTPAFRARYQAAAGAFAERSSAGRRSIDQGLRDLSGETGDTTWNGMSEQEQTSAIAFGLLMILLLRHEEFDLVGSEGTCAVHTWHQTAMLLAFTIVSSIDLLGGHMVSAWWRGLAGAILAVLVWFAVYLAIDWMRQRRFDRVELPKMEATVDADGA